jgi:PAS domain S-box-containing protein
MQMAADDAKDARSNPVVAGAVSPRILVVDDDDNTAQALSKLIANEGYDARTASDGRTALAFARSWAPDLVVTDLAMPVMNGVDLCRRLHEIDRDLPIIIVTAVEQAQAGSACLEAGAEDYLTKPLQLPALAWSVQRALERRDSKRERDRLRERADTLNAELRKVNERLVVSSVREQERAESEAQQRTELDALLRGLSEGIIVAEAQGNVRMINRAACEILGLEREPRRVDALCAHDLRDTTGRRLHDDEHPLRRALRGDDFTEVEVSCVLPTGQKIRLATTGTAVRQENGDVVVAIVVIRDITELRRLERQREDYTAMISHDLRSPLNVVELSATLLERSLAQKGLAKELEHVGRVRRSSKQMVTMLDELVEATSLEAKGTQLQWAPCDLAELVSDVLSQLDETRARRIRVERAGTASRPVLGDAGKLERCITNLLTNALKYSREDAPVQVRLSQTASEAELDVIDHGIGIAPEHTAQVFDRYHRTAAGRRQAEGLGLGLYITRLIVEAHGGRIDVVSEVGKGSTFRLILPLQPARPS